MVLATTDFGIKVAFIATFAFVLGLVVVVPMTVDLVFAQLKRQPNETPEGTSWLARATMALAVIVIVGFVALYVLVEQPFGKNQRIISDIVVALTTTLASIVAFYFGSKSSAAAAGKTSPVSTTIAIAVPKNGGTYKVGEVVRASYSATGTFAALMATTANGAVIATAAAGPETFWVSARAADGHEVAAKTVNNTVVP